MQAWLEYAEADRRSARNALNAADYRDAAFHCQQVIEKILKAIIVSETGRPPPYGHDLRTLLRNIRGFATPEAIARWVSDLDIYYTGTRYPGPIIDPNAYSEARTSALVERMEEVFQWFLTNAGLENT